MFTSLFKANTTSGSLFTHSVDPFPSLKFISWLYWKVKRRSLKVRSSKSLDDSPIPVNVHIPSSYSHIMFCHFSRDVTHEFMPRNNLKNFWQSQWSTFIDSLKSFWDPRKIFWAERFSSLESACNINNCQCVFIVKLLTNLCLYLPLRGLAKGFVNIEY